jgi:phage baseplate assembly protein gpV
MATQATLRTVQSVLNDDGVDVMPDEREYRWTVAAGVLAREEVSLTGSAFTALTVPTNAKKVRLIIPAAAVSLTLKGVTGDTGTTITPASNYIGGTVELTLGASPSLGILNGSATARTITAIWL